MKLSNTVFDFSIIDASLKSSGRKLIPNVIVHFTFQQLF